MATLSQVQLFSWDEVEASPEILRLSRTLEALPDEKVIAALLHSRKGKRNDRPVEAAWNSLVAGIVFGHDGVESRAHLASAPESRHDAGHVGLVPTPPDSIP